MITNEHLVVREHMPVTVCGVLAISLAACHSQPRSAYRRHCIIISDVTVMLYRICAWNKSIRTVNPLN